MGEILGAGRDGKRLFQAWLDTYMTLLEALESLSPSDRHRVEELLTIFSKHTALCLRMRTNLDSESRLPEEAWKALFDAFLRVDLNGGLDLIQKAIAKGLRPWTLCGPPVASLKPPVLGRAVSLDYFCRSLVEGGYFGSVESARRNIRNILSKPKEVVARRWQTYPLGKYLMWSTFTAEGSQADPFGGMPNSAKGVRGVLGLDPNDKDRPLLLLTYTLPSNIPALFPTIAEAYAGDKWNYFFTPAPAGAAYGMTLPWPEYEDYSPRPEVVHGVILGGRITSPIRKIS